MASKKGPFCSCVEHSVICTRDSAKVVRISSKKIKVGTLNFMKNECLIPNHASAVCEDCITYAEKMMAFKNKRFKVDEYGILLEKIENDKVPADKLIDIVKAVGKKLSHDIMIDANNISDEYKNETMSDTFNTETWLSNRNKVVIAFLMACADIENLQNKKKNVCIMGAVDSLYKARLLNLVTPVPFLTNIINYYISGSSYLTRLNCTYSPAGSYSCLKTWLSDIASSPVSVEKTDNDVVTFFDNNQVVARNWRVTYNHKTKASVVTTLIHINPSDKTQLQMIDNFSPNIWLHNVENNNDLQDKISTHLKGAEKTYDNIRNQFLANRLTQVESQNQVVNGRMKDQISSFINDNVNPNLTPSTPDPYSWVKSGHGDTVPTISVGEPCMVNPCSFDSVSKVLTHIQEQSSGKKWIAVGCDGLPYTLAQKLIPKNDNLKNILLLPGNGHVEMNATKALFKILWDVALEDLAKLNGFRTPRALLAARNCADHHKSWAILMTFLFGTLDELIQTYIISCNERSLKADVAGFYSFIKDSKSPNYRFLADIILNYVMALFVFRCGVRRSNYKFIEAGRSKIIKLFYGLGMTNYQFLTFCDLKARVLAPPEILKFIQETESFSVSGNNSKGEGGDFILESINARTKRWLPPGVPSEKHWKQVCRNIDKMDQIRDKLHNELGIKRKSPLLYQRDMSRETFQWRVMLRESGYLGDTENSNQSHTSISGNTLDRELLCFEKVLIENFSTYLTCIATGHQPGKVVKMEPVFTTSQDREKYHDIRCKTKAQISAMIEAGISDIASLGNYEEALVLERQWEKIKVRTKDALLQFYREVTTALQDATTIEEGTDSEDEYEDDSL